MSLDRKVGWIKLDRKMVDVTGANSGEIEGFVEQVYAIKGLEIALFFRERDGKKIKVSFRSKGGVDVNSLAAKFGGGGHRQAAGCILTGTMGESVRRVLEAINEDTGYRI